MRREIVPSSKFKVSRQGGFSIVAAIFLLVVLALLGAFIVSVTGMQQSSGQLDVLGVRAYQSARAGMEWGASQVLDPNNTLNAGSCSPIVMPSCPASPTNLSSLAGSLSGFTVSVTCAQTADTTEGNRNVRMFQLVATACNQPSAGSCPNAAPAGGYVERQMQASVAKCKDSTAAAPRCACG
ncbi:MAG TPA: agglutinin biogenesis protein MshP [Burkholderiales bacterium]|nr:agglutinin biogenesis protein MshP [Burkholderiales bacterium]